MTAPRIYAEGERFRLWHGDCRDVLAGMEAGSVDAVVTDPPYELPNGFGEQRKLNGARRLQFEWDTRGITEDVLEALALAWGVAGERAGAFVFCGLEQFARMAAQMRDAGFTPKPAAWVKTCPPPAMPGNWWPSGFEVAVYGYRPGAWFGDADPKRSNVFRADSYRHGQPGKVDHPTQKPLDLMRRIVRSIVPPGGLVLDPFAGSGTTGVAALMEGRRFVGIEREERYCAIAARRLRAAESQGVLALPATARAEQGRLPGVSR